MKQVAVLKHHKGFFTQHVIASFWNDQIAKINILQMFIRFLANTDHPSLNAELGMFAARDTIDFSRLKGSVQRAHEEAFYWFSPEGGGGLTYPRLRGKVRTPDIRKSLFWFREDAKFYNRAAGNVITRARELASALTLAGCEIREIRTRDPGKIIWQDHLQVLARPKSDDIPRAF
ncbi:hypothetical protein [Ruegeria arenilitoris]|uniref:hypothetical protein n=1 Tax=Ruegeria arenilitoris TaxID=1173585 RepID=UPI00147CAFA8|nr:hypothetical protein [Ruegeria arenilitoris]